MTATHVHGIEALVHTAASISGAVETVIDGKPDVVRLAVTVLLAEGHLLHRGRARRRQDHAGEGPRAARSTARCAASSSPRTCCRATSPGSASSTRSGATSSSGPGAIFAERRRRRRDQPGLARRPSPRCSSAWRSGRSPSTAPPTASGRPSWWSPPRTRSRWRAPTRCPRRSATASWRGCRWATPTAGAELEMLDAHGAAIPLDGARARSPTPRDVRAADRDRPAGVYAADAVKQYVVDLVAATRATADLRLGASPARHAAPAAGRQGPGGAATAATTSSRTTSRRSAVPVLAHRLLPTADAQLARRSPEDVLHARSSPRPRGAGPRRELTESAIADAVA